MVDTIAIGAAAGGLLLGYLLGRAMAPGSSEARALEKQLQEARAEKQQLAGAVREHFVTTAEKINRLTEQHRDVYQHLASGAASLCGSDDAAAFAALEGPRDIEGEVAGDADAEPAAGGDGEAAPPRDYAPKTSPDEPGVLNERFGLDGEAPADAAGSEDEAAAKDAAGGDDRDSARA